MLDARAYDEWARQIAAGAWIGQDAFWVDPLYAYVLGAIYRVAGHGLLLPRLANMAFGVLTALVAAHIAWRCWGSRLAAVLTALMVGIFVPAIHFEGQIEKTALSVLLLVAGVDLFLAGTTGAILGAGIVAGLATLARGNTLLLLPLTALVLALGWDRERGDPLVATRNERLGRAALFLAAALPLIALATLHNYLASGEFVPTTTNLGVNLYLGNHSGNAYGYYEPPEFLHPNTSDELPDFHAEATRRTGQKLTDRTLSDYWAGQTWQAIKADPGLAVARTVHKLQLALNRDEVPDSDDVALVAQWSPVLRAPILWFGQLLPLGLLGAFVGRRRRPVRVVLVVTATYVLSLLPFFVMARLRIQLVPFLAVLASGALVWILAMVRGGQRRPLLVAAVIVVAGLCVTFYTPEWMAKRRTSSLAIGWHNLGASLADEGRSEEAVRAYEHAVEIDATAVPAALRVLGKIYQQRGDYQRAEEAMRKVVELRPDSPSAREALRGLYDVMLADARWRDDAEIRRRRQALGAGAQAAPAPAAPSNPAAAVMAKARSFGSKGQFDEAIAVLQQAVREGPVRRRPALHARPIDGASLHARGDGNLLLAGGRSRSEAADQPLLLGRGPRASGRRRRRDRPTQEGARDRPGARDEPVALGRAAGSSGTFGGGTRASGRGGEDPLGLQERARRRGARRRQAGAKRGGRGLPQATGERRPGQSTPLPPLGALPARARPRPRGLGRDPALPRRAAERSRGNEASRRHSHRLGRCRACRSGRKGGARCRAAPAAAKGPGSSRRTRAPPSSVASPAHRREPRHGSPTILATPRLVLSRKTSPRPSRKRAGTSAASPRFRSRCDPASSSWRRTTRPPLPRPR